MHGPRNTRAEARSTESKELLPHVCDPGRLRHTCQLQGAPLSAEMSAVQKTEATYNNIGQAQAIIKALGWKPKVVIEPGASWAIPAHIYWGVLSLIFWVAVFQRASNDLEKRKTPVIRAEYKEEVRATLAPSTL